MTLETEPMTAPKPVPVRRRPAPAPRAKEPIRASNESNGDLGAQLAAMQAKIDQLEARGRFVEGEPTNTVGVTRVADDVELTPWQLRIRDKTEPTPTNIERAERAYNYPEKYYMKSDGMVVSLQGDPQNYAYYTTKKRFHALTDAEVREYLTVERPRIVKLQQQKANLINTIRRAVQVDPALAAGLDPSWERDHDRMSIGELQDQLDEIAGTPTSTGAKRRIMKRLPRLQDADDRAADAEMQRMMSGVETTASRSAESVFERLRANQPQTREIEVTARNARSFT